MLPGSPPSLRLAWARVPPGASRREIAWNLIRDLAPAAVLSNPCPFCGGPHGPVRVDGAEVAASVTYAGAHALVAVVDLAEASTLGIDAELAVDGQRDAVGFTGVLGDGRPADVRAWTRVEAALKADGRGLRVDPSRVTVMEYPGGWTAHVPGRPGELLGRDVRDAPTGLVVSAAWLRDPGTYI